MRARRITTCSSVWCCLFVDVARHCVWVCGNPIDQLLIGLAVVGCLLIVIRQSVNAVMNKTVSSYPGCFKSAGSALVASPVTNSTSTEELSCLHVKMVARKTHRSYSEMISSKGFCVRGVSLFHCEMVSSSTISMSAAGCVERLCMLYVWKLISTLTSWKKKKRPFSSIQVKIPHQRSFEFFGAFLDVCVEWLRASRNQELHLLQNPAVARLSRKLSQFSFSRKTMKLFETKWT